MEFSDTVREIRLRLGETQAEFGKRIGRSLNYVSELERGVREPSETVRHLIEYMTPDEEKIPRVPRRGITPKRDTPKPKEIQDLEDDDPTRPEKCDHCPSRGGGGGSDSGSDSGSGGGGGGEGGEFLPECEYENAALLLHDIIRRLSVPALRGYIEILGTRVAEGDMDALRVAGVIIPHISESRPEVFERDDENPGMNI